MKNLLFSDRFRKKGITSDLDIEVCSSDLGAVGYKWFWTKRHPEILGITWRRLNNIVLRFSSTVKIMQGLSSLIRRLERLWENGFIHTIRNIILVSNKRWQTPTWKCYDTNKFAYFSTSNTLFMEFSLDFRVIFVYFKVLRVNMQFCIKTKFVFKNIPSNVWFVFAVASQKIVTLITLQFNARQFKKIIHAGEKKLNLK